MLRVGCIVSMAMALGAGAASGQTAALVADLRTTPLSGSAQSSSPRPGALLCGDFLDFVAAFAAGC